jgi:predicted RNA binding protein YcfA (HicA-like mRNA interferase family)
MPRKVRELEADLARAGFTRQPGKGSHRKWLHPKYKGSVTISGQPGADARHYQEEKVAAAIAAVKGAQ